MRNLFAFLRRHSIFLLFLIAEITCFVLLFRYNRYHQSVYLDIASEVTGRIQTRVNTVEGYFYLRQENELLRKRLNDLQNSLSENVQAPDTAMFVRDETFLLDSSRISRKYIYREARVVNNSISQPNNFITLHRGIKEGVEPGMVVIGPEGIVGVVLDVSDHFSYVMSVLHKQSRISARLKKTGESGRIEWDGVDPSIVLMRDIPKSVKPAKGDSVETSQYSDFPPGIPIGKIENIIPEKSTNNYSIQVRLFTPFSRLQHVFIVENRQRNEQQELENRTRGNR